MHLECTLRQTGPFFKIQEHGGKSKTKQTKDALTCSLPDPSSKMGSSAAAVSSSVCIFFPATPSLPQNRAQAAPTPVTSEGRDLPGGDGSSVTPSAATRDTISRWRGLRQISIIYSRFRGTPFPPVRILPRLLLRSHLLHPPAPRSEKEATKRPKSKPRRPPQQPCSPPPLVTPRLHKRAYVHVGARDRQRARRGGSGVKDFTGGSAPFIRFLRKDKEDKRVASKYGNQDANGGLRLTLFGHVCASFWVPIDVIYQQPPHLFT